MKYYLLDNNNLKHFKPFYNEEWDANNSIIIGAFNEGDDDLLIPRGILKSDIIENIYLVSWLYVDPDYRLNGIGTGLLDTLKESAQNAYLQVQYRQEDADVVSFLDKYGLDTSFSVSCYNLSFDIYALDPRIRDLPSSSNVCSLDNLTKKQVISFNECFSKSTKEEQIFHTIHYPLSQYHKDSVCYVKDGNIASYILIEQPKSEIYNSITIKFIYAHKGNPQELAILLSELYKRIINDFPQGMTLSISLFDHSKCDLLSKVFSDYKIETIKFVGMSI